MPTHINNNDFFISKLLFSPSTQQNNKKKSPQQLRIKNNILLLMFCLICIGIYYLFSGFMNVMLLSFIGGFWYSQIRERFIKYWIKEQKIQIKQQDNQYNKIPLTTKILYVINVITGVILICILPVIKNIVINLSDFIIIYKQMNISSISIDELFKYQSNPQIIILQIYLFIKLITFLTSQQFFFNLFLSLKSSSYFYKIFPHYNQQQKKIQNSSFCKFIFGFFIIIVLILIITILPSMYIMELADGVGVIETQVKKYLECEIVKNNNNNDNNDNNNNNDINDNDINNNNNKEYPLCTDIFLKNNTYVIQVIQQFKAHRSQTEQCMFYLSSIQTKLLGSKIFYYDQITCTWFFSIQKALTYFTPNDFDMLSTSTTFFKTIFNNITYILLSFSNIIFDLTTFITVFFFTVEYFNPRSDQLKNLFEGERKEMFAQIAYLINANIFISVEHFVISVIFLEMVNFSQFNIIISTVLSLMAFVPFFRPWVGMLIFSIIKLIFTQNIAITILCFFIYQHISQKIFTDKYKTVKIHQIITNLSILFGIYKFGIAGIFYGPILLILFTSVHSELFNHTNNQNKDIVNNNKKEQVFKQNNKSLKIKNKKQQKNQKKQKVQTELPLKQTIIIKQN